MEAAPQSPHWEESLFPIFNKLANDGREMNNEFIRKNRQVFETDRNFIPFESFTDLFEMESRKELSLIAFSISGDKVVNSDIILCELLGRELDQCREDSHVKLTVNKNPFLKNEKDTDLNACNNLFDMIKIFRPKLTSSQFLYILLGIQQKNFNMLLSAFKSIAFDLALEANKDQIRRILKKDSQDLPIQERESLTGRIFANPSTINIHIVLPKNLEHAPENVEYAFVYWNASIPIQIALDSGIVDVFFIETFFFHVDVTASDDLYYEMHEKYIDFIINMFKYYYTFLIKNVKFSHSSSPLTPMTTSLDTESYQKLLRETEEAQRKAKRTPQEVAADEKEKEEKVQLNLVARLAADEKKKEEKVQLNLVARLAARGLMGGKRQEASRLRSSKKHFLRKNKSRRKNKLRLKNKSRRRNK
jgi:hypothetical protein